MLIKVVLSVTFGLSWDYRVGREVVVVVLPQAKHPNLATNVYLMWGYKNKIPKFLKK
jgi:hypothetical protein